MKRKQVDSIYKWNLNNIYKTKKKFKKDLDIVIKKNKELLKYKNKLGDFKVFKDFFLENEKINKLEEKMQFFLCILQVEQNNQFALDLESLYSQKMMELDGKFTWISEEVSKFNQKDFLNFIQNDIELKYYYKYYQDFFKELKYMLPYKQRKILSRVTNSSSIIYEMYETLLFKDNKHRKVEINNKIYELNSSTYSDLLLNSRPIEDQMVRVKFSLEFKKELKEKKHTLIKLYDNIVRSNIEHLKLIKKENFYDYFFDKEDFYKLHLEVLLNAAKESSNLNNKYLKLYKDFFKFDNKFYSTDTSLKFYQADKNKISVDNAKEIIKKHLSCLGQEYMNFLDIAFENHKIDYYEDENKATGAFTIPSYDFDNLISMNWTDDFESVYTLIHELGHSVHSLFANKYQPKPLNTFGNLIAEIASTFNEHLLSDKLLKNSDHKQKINILQNNIDFIASNFFSSARWTKFEIETFKLVENNQIINYNSIKNIIDNTFKKSDLLDEYDEECKYYDWTQISHLYEEPFYLYKYAVSIAFSYHLYNDFVINNDYNKFISFLKEGGSLEPLELFKKYGFDCTKSDSYLPLIKHFENLITQLENLLKKINTNN
ncbi:oligoendopeptidase F [Spiroplasma gladiatoris]|uniref:Oligoendopeptidase F n=1 Tax=Spiroplasma gladiatoris TaxID=2143 RepID=A0A4P7AHI9_9MOLU|nr:M3 family metallopeptidase [Spiroplasma gladiatoris]QBQ07662.1 oligoendopeptidase F [Spiroplasma gladiatoris]